MRTTSLLMKMVSDFPFPRLQGSRSSTPSSSSASPPPPGVCSLSASRPVSSAPLRVPLFAMLPLGTSEHVCVEEQVSCVFDCWDEPSPVFSAIFFARHPLRRALLCFCGSLNVFSTRESNLFAPLEVPLARFRGFLCLIAPSQHSSSFTSTRRVSLAAVVVGFFFKRSRASARALALVRSIRKVLLSGAFTNWP